MSYGYDYGYGYGNGTYLGVIAIIAVISAIAATVLAFIFILPEKKKDKLNGFGRLLHNIGNFKSLMLEKILQAVYIFLTVVCIIYGFFSMFSSWVGGRGLIIMLVGPIVIRLAFELTMMFILLVKNVIQINNKLKNNSDGNNQEDVFAMPIFSSNKSEPEQPVQPVQQNEAVFCTNCGSQLVNGICPYCQGNYNNYN